MVWFQFLEDRDWNKIFFAELEKFDGKRSTATRKDDIADSLSLAFNIIATSKELKPLDPNKLKNVLRGKL